jgi:osmotically-inducible protein OsmY
MGRLLSRGRRRPPATPATRTALLVRVREALAAHAALAGLPIEARARGAGVELAGWVTSRSARSLAFRLARQAAGVGHEIINHLLVRGEDDRASAREESPRTA